jgi:RecJ-like exonuclease
MLTILAILVGLVVLLVVAWAARRDTQASHPKTPADRTLNPVSRKCPVCRGVGVVWTWRGDLECDACGGTGKVVGWEERR